VTVPHAPASAPGPAAGAGGAELAGTAAGAPPVATTEPGVPTPAGGETAQAGGEAAAPEGDEGAPVLDAPPSGERRTVRRKRVVSGDRPPRSRQEAKLLLRQADARAAQLEWSDARAAYERVAAGRYLRDRALLGMARIAFETKDTAGAIAHAHKALRSGAGDRARILLGHAYYKQGNFARALEYYQAVLRANPRNEEARRAAEDARDRLGRGVTGRIPRLAGKWRVSRPPAPVRRAPAGDRHVGPATPRSRLPSGRERPAGPGTFSQPWCHRTRGGRAAPARRPQ
jgi:hypothetical protein